MRGSFVDAVSLNETRTFFHQPNLVFLCFQTTTFQISYPLWLLIIFFEFILDFNLDEAAERGCCPLFFIHGNNIHVGHEQEGFLCWRLFGLGDEMQQKTSVVDQFSDARLVGQSLGKRPSEEIVHLGYRVWKREANFSLVLLRNCWELNRFL